VAFLLDRYDAYDAVLVGASLHMARYQRYMRDVVRRHRADLERLPSAVFSVSLWEALPTPATRAQLERAQRRFFDETGWPPRMVASSGGALACRRHGFRLRNWMQAVTWIFGRGLGQPIDASRNSAYTDWDAVTRIADRFAAHFVAPAASQESVR
jgi:menaquinone-dependent protoporphyrinogen oxidase